MTIFGIDIASYQQGINLQQARAEGIEFCIAKVTEGSTYRSPAWPAQRDQARAAGMLLAGYHYVRVGDPAGQAAACRAWLGDPSIPVMLDWENNGGGWPNFQAVLTAFRATGLRVVLGYIPGWYHTGQGRPDLRGTGLAVVASRYPTNTVAAPAAVYRSVPADAWAGYGGVDPTILQFSDRALVAGLQVDANAYRGTREQLAVLLGGLAPSPTPREPDFMATMSEDEKQQLLEAARAVVFGVAGQRDAGPLALSVAMIRDQLDTLSVRVSELHSAGGDVQAGPAVPPLDLDALAAKVVDLLAARLHTT